MDHQDRTGQQFGCYRLTRHIGGGGFADVYLGEHAYLHTPAAIKVLRHLEPLEQEKFEVEARTIAGLTHPHIVPIMEFGFEKNQGNVPYLVMAYAKGETIRKQYPRGSKLPLATIVTYMDQVAQALQYAHNKKIIHRDVKPENMLLNDNKVWLSDFGLAVLSHSSASQPLIEAIGTLPYMAPEQIDEVPKLASDQYSLGIVVYEWLCGQCPFVGPPRDVMLQQVNKHKKAPSLREKDPTIPAAIEEVVMRALEKDYHDRYASVEEFAREFTRAYQRQAGRLAPSLLPPAPIAAPAPRPAISVPDPTPVTPAAPKVAIPPPPSLQREQAAVNTVPPAPGRALPRADVPAFDRPVLDQAAPKLNIGGQESPAFMPSPDSTAHKQDAPAPRSISPIPEAPAPQPMSLTPDTPEPRPASYSPDGAVPRPALPMDIARLNSAQPGQEWFAPKQPDNPSQIWAGPNQAASPSWPGASPVRSEPNQVMNSNPPWGTPGPSAIASNQAPPRQPGGSPSMGWNDPNQVPPFADDPNHAPFNIDPDQPFDQKMAMGETVRAGGGSFQSSQAVEPPEPNIWTEISTQISRAIEPHLDSYAPTAKARGIVGLRTNGMFLILLSTLVVGILWGWYAWLIAGVSAFLLFTCYIRTLRILVIIITVLLACYWAVVGYACGELLHRLPLHLSILPPSGILSILFLVASLYFYFIHRETKGRR